jgi:hypothetical protein
MNKLHLLEKKRRTIELVFKKEGELLHLLVKRRIADSSVHILRKG